MAGEASSSCRHLSHCRLRVLRLLGGQRASPVHAEQICAEVGQSPEPGAVTTPPERPIAQRKAQAFAALAQGDSAPRQTSANSHGTACEHRPRQEVMKARKGELLPRACTNLHGDRVQTINKFGSHLKTLARFSAFTSNFIPSSQSCGPKFGLVKCITAKQITNSASMCAET